MKRKLSVKRLNRLLEYDRSHLRQIFTETMAHPLIREAIRVGLRVGDRLKSLLPKYFTIIVHLETLMKIVIKRGV